MKKEVNRGIRLPSREAYKSSRDSQHTALLAVVISYHSMNTYTTHLLCSQQAETQKWGCRVVEVCLSSNTHQSNDNFANRLTLLNFSKVVP